ncbi:TetR/AcrR family transcriptional regulator [Novosphingobium aerophilum]|uniref:TetR/AcrR family transcriptional regulator n=1 Tax=Novosphingobium aerophilum TaxID=2839843 RepID=A0A7X1KAS4_9SPHN|nr:TetR/AcrR family transcriptional regulator [Novosphingobium aerophilum]MBC2650435.1 TetR/AcrR family transcriptional regulator [Novosphingobium aerophilum]
MPETRPQTLSRAGRPSRAEAEARIEELLESALDLFLTHGFERTSIDAIAAAVRMNKRTVYARFADKSALFLAAVQRAIARDVIPVAILTRLDSGDVEDSLVAIGRLRIEHFLQPAALRLQRILRAESIRFPQIADWHFELSTLPFMTYVAGLLQRAMDEGRIRTVDAAQAAAAFMSLVVGGQVRPLVAGRIPSPGDIDRRIRFAVDLILHGLLQH